MKKSFITHRSFTNGMGLGLLSLLTLVLVACGPDNKHIKLTGKLLNLNQGEFLVFSPDGALASTDTIYIEGGRFTFEPRCEHEGSMIIVLPNKQEIPIFVEPGKSYSLEGDAHNMKELNVKGGKDNELMSAFRSQLKDKEENYQPISEVKAFVDEHNQSPVGIYLVRRYCLDSETPNFSAAADALAKLSEAQPDNAALKVMHTQVDELKNTSAGASLPSFSVQDINGNIITDRDLSSGVAIIIAQASWDFESTSQMNRIMSTRRDLSKNWKLVVLSFDAAKNQCKNTVHMDAKDGYIIFDGNMSENALARKLAIAQTGTVVVVQNGRIKERDLNGERLIQKLKEL